MTPLPEPIDGISFRHFGGDEDYAGMVEVLNKSSRHDGIDRHETVEDMSHGYHHLTNCDLDTDLIIAEKDHGIVGYRRVLWWIEEATGDRVLAHVGWVHPAIRQHGVGTILVGWSESRLRDVSEEHTHDGRQVFEAWAEVGEAEATADLIGMSYETTETYAEMRRSLADPIEDHPFPDGLEIRSMTPADRRMVWEADQEAFRDHVGFSPATEADYEEFAGRRTMVPDLWKVAFDGDLIAGQVLNYVDPAENDALGRLRGWTEWISTQRPWRGKGVAKALITESMRMFEEMGMTEVGLGVHTTNPTGAYQLYEGLGYCVTSQTHEFRKSFEAR